MISRSLKDDNMLPIPNNTDVVCYFVTKHSWRGKYKRIFSVGTHGITTYNPNSLEITNRYSYNQIISIQVDPQNAGGFVLSVRDKNKLDKFKFSTDFRSNLLTDALKFRHQFSERGQEEIYNYEALKYHWSDTRLPVTINVTPISIDQLDTATAQVLASYRYKDIEAIQHVEDIPGGFVIISRPYGRMHLFISSNREEIFQKVKERAMIYLQIPIEFFRHSITHNDFLTKRLGRYSSDEHVTSVCEFQVKKIGVPRHQECPQRRLLCLSEVCLLERDPQTYTVVTLRPLSSVFALIRDPADAQQFCIEYADSSCRSYTATNRDSLLATLLDSVRSSGNHHIHVKLSPTPRDKRLIPFNVSPDQEIESNHLKCIKEPPPRKSFAEVLDRFNANIEYSGLIHSVSEDKLFTENKEKLIVMALTSIIAHQGDQNEISVHELEAQFHALRRLFATKAGFSTFIMLPEYKINVSNAFDIDMIGYFYSWLEKKKSSIFDDNDITSFQEISDYLEASAKVYSYRVDNLTETTSRLVEQFKSMNYKKSSTPMDEDNAPKIQKAKRQRTMLTTNEKLRRKPNENETTFNPDHSTSSFNCNELFSTNRPSTHLLSMYAGKSLAEEMKDAKDRQKDFDEKKKNEETILVDKSFLHTMDVFIQGAICPEFKGFIAEHDKVDDSNDDKLDGIEYRFDPNNHQFQNNSEDSVHDDNEPDNNELDPNSYAKDTTVLDGLLECIDNVDRDYSFFNPKLLANWKGPKAWKAQAMVKALKSCTPSERKEIDENMDECTQQNIKQCKTKKKRNQVKNDKVKINWLVASQINEIFENNIKGKEQILARTLQKWDPLDHIADTQIIDVDIKYKFEFLQHMEIKPDWWIHKNRKKDICSEASNSCQNINNCGESIVETSEPMEIDHGDSEQSTNGNDEEIINDGTDDILDVSRELNSEDEDVMGDIKSESRMDIAELKKEIFDIIDKECVETDPNSEWSSKLSFFNLLTKLRINERDGLSIPMVFVGLLHLANERGLKLLQEHCTINDMEETFIAKPMK